jgi:Derlin-1
MRQQQQQQQHNVIIVQHKTRLMYHALLCIIFNVLLYTTKVHGYRRITSINRDFGLYQTHHQYVNERQNNVASTTISTIPRGGATRMAASKKKGKATTSTTKKTTSATGKKKVTGSESTQQRKAIEEQKESPVGNLMAKYKKMLPLTRIYITMVGICTTLGLLLGEELTQTLLSLDPIRTIYGFELWRPITAACFLGPPSVGWLMNGYYLFQYGSTLEKAYGSAQHLIFLLSQIVSLSILSMLLGQPFYASSVITAMLHVLSRAMPYQNVQWLVFTVPYWSLPYGLMATDVLQAQGNAMAALPHILGILSGHVYQFHKFIWPKLNPIKNDDWLLPPEFISKKLDPNYKTADQKAAITKASLSKILKKGKKQRRTISGGTNGRKLGSSK